MLESPPHTRGQVGDVVRPGHTPPNPFERSSNIGVLLPTSVREQQEPGTSTNSRRSKTATTVFWIF